MRTSIYIREVIEKEGQPVGVLNKYFGHLTDQDIFAGEGQKVFMNDKKYEIYRITFWLSPEGKAIDTEKRIILEEVEI